MHYHACFRCESKNGLIKKLDYKSFKNICLSVTEKHQFWMASIDLEQQKKNSIKYIDNICNVEQTNGIEPSILEKLNVKSSVNVCKFIKIEGFKYKPGCYLIINLDYSVGMMSVGLIKEIFVVDGLFVFYLQLCNIAKKNLKLNCLEIALVAEHKIMKLEDLFFKQAQFGMYFKNKLNLQIRYYHHLIE